MAGAEAEGVAGAAEAEEATGAAAEAGVGVDASGRD